MRAAFLVLLTLSLAGVATSEDRPSPPRTITLNLCATDVSSHEWSDDLFQTLSEVLEMGEYPKDLEIELSSMGEACKNRLVGCKGEPNGQILCNEQSINRLLQASAWLAAHDAQQIVRLHQQIPLKPILEEVGEMDFYAALQITDAINDGDADKASRLITAHRLTSDLRELVAEVRKTETDPHYRPAAAQTVWVAGRMHDVASSELVAVLLGHELSHAMGGCHLSGRSSVELSGLFEKVDSMQSRGAGFVRNPTLVDETLADKCALRVLERVDAAWVRDDSTFDPQIRSLAQRTTYGGRWIALDAYAELLTNSLRGRTDWDPESQHIGLYQLGPNFEQMALEAEGSEGYLYPALRLALVATTLHERQASEDPHHTIVLCEDTARQFVAMLHIAGELPKDNKSPEFADLFGTIVPSGVVVGLRTGVWREKYPGWSYACDQ